MITCITNSCLLDKALLDNVYAMHGASPFQSYFAINSRMKTLFKDSFACFVCTLDGHVLISAFEQMENRIWKCFLLKEPILSTRDIDKELLLFFLQEILKTLDAQSLYFPYLYGNTDAYSLFNKLPNCISIKRLSSPNMRWKEDDHLFTERIKGNSKNRAERYWKRFEKQLHLTEIFGDQAVEAIDMIEKKSWKHGTQQSMHCRDNQFQFYANWLRSRDLFLHIAEDNGMPIAYRLDAKLDKTVYTLKYSYNEEYKKFSPGYYLLTKGIFERWKDVSIEAIDLWGSPDMLKNILQTGQYERYDFLWPSTARGKQLLEERISHDEKLLSNLNNKIGLKAQFYK